MPVRVGEVIEREIIVKLVTFLSLLALPALMAIEASAQLRFADPWQGAPPLSVGREAQDEDSGSSYFSITNDSLGPVAQGFSLFYESVELDELDFDQILSDGSVAKVRLQDEDRDRFGIRYQAGTEWVSAHVHVFMEDFLGDGYDSIGVGGGLSAEPRIGSVDGIGVHVSMRASLNYVTGDADLPILDPLGGAMATVSQEDIHYLNGQGEAGFFLDICGFRPGAGIAIDHLDGEIDNPLGGEDLDLDGTNFGVYARLAFFQADCPFIAEVTGGFGDLRGVWASLGLRF